MQQQIAVAQSDKEIRLRGRDILHQEGINTVCDEKLPAIMGYKAHVDPKPGSQPMLRQGILEPVQPVGVTNASPIIWQRKEIGVLRLSLDLKVHIDGKILNQDYPIPNMETIVDNLHGTS